MRFIYWTIYSEALKISHLATTLVTSQLLLSSVIKMREKLIMAACTDNCTRLEGENAFLFPTKLISANFDTGKGGNWGISSNA